MKPKVFMRWMVPGPRHHKDRLHIFRGYFRDYQKSRILFYYQKLSDVQAKEAEKIADDLIEKWMKDGFQAEQDSGYHFSPMIQDVEIWRKTRKTEQRKEARASRTLKSYRKKVLWLLLGRISLLHQTRKV